MSDRTGFVVSSNEVDCIAVAYDELLSYWETVGYEGSLDADEMPTDVIPDSLAVLRGLLDRFAQYEALTTAASKHGAVISVAPVRFTYRPDTPPTGPEPSA